MGRPHSDLEENQKETPVVEEEIEEQDTNLEQEQRQQQQLPQKRKIKILDYLNGKDAKKKKKNRH